MEQVRPPLVDIGGQKPPAQTELPAHFLTKEEVAKVVAEKRIAPPVPNESITIPAEPPFAAPAPKAPPIDLRRAASPPSSPSYPQPSSPNIPPSSPHVFPPSKVPPIDLRVALPKLPDVESTLPVGHGPSRALPLSEESISAAGRSIPEAEPLPVTPAATSSKIPPIDLRPQTPPKPPTPDAPKARPWSGSDPYREPVE